MWLIAGLGNPGSVYEKNRHNVGFRVVDAINQFYHLSYKPNTKFHGFFSTGSIKTDKVLTLKPSTYMNLSGKSVLAVASFYKIPPHDIIIIHDEIDLPLGCIRVRRAGGTAGHNGLKNIESVMGKDTMRVRIGVGHPGHRDLVSDYVLSDFDHNEEPTIISIVTQIAHSIEVMVKEGIDAFQNKCNAITP